MIRLVIYLDDILIMGRTMEEIITHRDSVIFLLENLGFVINWEKSILTPVREIDFLGITINSQSMTMTVSQEKVDKLISLCQKVLSSKEVSLQDLSSLIGKLIATSPAVTPACLQTRYLMMWQIQELKYSSSYTSKTQLDNLSRRELEWWIENLEINKGKSILTRHPDMIIQTDASLTGWRGGALSGDEDRRCMDTRRDQLSH